MIDGTITVAVLTTDIVVDEVYQIIQLMEQY